MLFLFKRPTQQEDGSYLSLPYFLVCNCGGVLPTVSAWLLKWQRTSSALGAIPRKRSAAAFNHFAVQLCHCRGEARVSSPCL